jgi:hypothetical protein
LSSQSVTTRLYPAGILNTLSRHEVERLHDASRGDLADLVRRCALAVLNSGNESDDAEALIEQYRDFKIEVQQVNRGLRLELINAPGSAFVDGTIIEGIRELISAVIRDLVYFDSEISGHKHHDLSTSPGITNAVFEMLRNAQSLVPQVEPDLVVCWGGHSIRRTEYEYTKQCGYELGLRNLNIITGCGPGAMKGPMKGATIAHSKQRVKSRRYIGISEPGWKPSSGWVTGLSFFRAARVLLKKSCTCSACCSTRPTRIFPCPSCLPAPRTPLPISSRSTVSSA